MTDIQQVIPAARPAGRGFRAYWAKHLDALVQRAGLPPAERLAVRAYRRRAAEYGICYGCGSSDAGRTYARRLAL